MLYKENKTMEMIGNFAYGNTEREEAELKDLNDALKKYKEKQSTVLHSAYILGVIHGTRREHEAQRGCLLEKIPYNLLECLKDDIYKSRALLSTLYGIMKDLDGDGLPINIGPPIERARITLDILSDYLDNEHLEDAMMDLSLYGGDA